MKGVVAVGPEYFKKSLQDYSNWKFAFWRELLQNNIDCGSTKINISVKLGDDNQAIYSREYNHQTYHRYGTVINKNIRDSDDDLVIEIRVFNDGVRMTKDEILNKLLCLGESSKDGVSTVGGFGKAKEVLYFAHESYTIISGTHCVTGTGGSFEYKESADFPGTLSIIKMIASNDEKYSFVFSLLNSLNDILDDISYKGKIFIEDHLANFNKRLGNYIYRDEDFSIRNDKDRTGMVVRAGGVPMFYSSIGTGGFVCELQKPSVEMLTASRDRLCHKYSNELDSIISDIIINPLSSRKKDVSLQPFTATVSGMSFIANKPLTQSVVVESAPNETVIEYERINLRSSFVELPHQTRRTNGNIAIDCPDEGYTLIFNSLCGKKIKRNFYHKDYVCNKLKKVLSVWARVLLEVHRVMDDFEPFTVGFLFDTRKHCDATLAVYSQDDGHKFLLSPTDSDYKRRYKRANQLVTLIPIAVHEWCHKQHLTHNEYFASLFTDAMSKIMSEINVIQKAVKCSYRDPYNFKWPTRLEV